MGGEQEQEQPAHDQTGAQLRATAAAGVGAAQVLHDSPQL